ncbi:MAG: hypothetical protein EB115_12975 [Betaproteobacteria bacterium]|nr:hypothetical protein [Betaproteobacteria bacterium]
MREVDEIDAWDQFGASEHQFVNRHEHGQSTTKGKSSQVTPFDLGTRAKAVAEKKRRRRRNFLTYIALECVEPPRESRRLVGFNHATAEHSC